MKKQPLVTVVTITFNLKKSKREKYFRQCLKSVHGQTYKNIEHIIVDGASKDGTVVIIKQYVEKGWIKYISEPDKGVYDAMNKGINLANGKYITFLNSDDFYHNNKAVELSVRALESSGADYSFSDTRAVNAKDDSEIGTWKGNINLIPFGTHYCHQSMFTRVDVLKEVGGFDMDHEVSADSDLMIKLVALNKKFAFVKDRIVSYRSGGLSNLHSQVNREEHSFAFYKYLGKDIGLTRKDCLDLWNFSVLTEKNFKYCLKLGLKLKKFGWAKEYYKRLFSFQNCKNHLKVSLPRPLARKLIFLSHLLRGEKDYYTRLFRWSMKKIGVGPQKRK